MVTTEIPGPAYWLIRRELFRVLLAGETSPLSNEVRDVLQTAEAGMGPGSEPVFRLTSSVGAAKELQQWFEHAADRLRAVDLEHGRARAAYTAASLIRTALKNARAW
jgi:hypothetical protein